MAFNKSENWFDIASEIALKVINEPSSNLITTGSKHLYNSPSILSINVAFPPSVSLDTDKRIYLVTPNYVTFTTGDECYFNCKGCHGQLRLDLCVKYFTYCIHRNNEHDLVGICDTCNKIKHICVHCLKPVAIRSQHMKSISSDKMADYRKHLIQSHNYDIPIHVGYKTVTMHVDE